MVELWADMADITMFRPRPFKNTTAKASPSTPHATFFETPVCVSHSQLTRPLAGVI